MKKIFVFFFLLSPAVLANDLFKECGSYHLKGIIKCSVDTKKKVRKGCRLFIGNVGIQLVGKNIYLLDFKDRAVEVTGQIVSLNKNSIIYLSSGMGLIDAENIGPGTQVQLLKKEKCEK